MDYIKIEGFKSIKSLELELLPINIIIGSNGSGKTNFMSFFNFLYHLYNRSLSEYASLRGGQDKFLYNGAKHTKELSFLIKFNGNSLSYSATLTPSDGGFSVTKEEVCSLQDRVSLEPCDNGSSLKLSCHPLAKSVASWLDGFRKYHFHDTTAGSAFNRSSNINTDVDYLYKNADNLAAFLYHIKESEPMVYGMIIEAIENVAPYFSDFHLCPDKSGNLKLLWKDKGSDIIFGVKDLSDGTIRFIALCTLFLQPNLPHTIIIDEPELGLHPFAISYLAGMIKSASERGCQVIVSTQSADLIGYFEPCDIITCDRQQGASCFSRLRNEDLEGWLEHYSLDELWRRHIIDNGHPNYN